MTASDDLPLLKPTPIHMFENNEMRELASIITRDIFTENPNVMFNVIAGLDAAKRVLKEAVVMPVKYPQYVVICHVIT